MGTYVANSGAALLTRWTTRMDSEPAASSVFVESLTPSQLEALVYELATRACYRMPPTTVAKALATLLRLQTLPERELFYLTKLLYKGDGESTLTCARLLLGHPNASEYVLQQLCSWASATAYPKLEEIAAELGWYYPLACQLTQTTRPETLPDSPALLCANELRAQLESASDHLIRVVRTLGPTWTGTVADLVMTARGIIR